jgi:hypothetical protein
VLPLATAFIARDDSIARESLARIGRGGLAHRAPARRIAQDADGGVHHAIDVAHGPQHARHTLAHDFREPTGL